MKKKTNLQTEPEGGAAQPRRTRQKAARQHGPQKEKTQITIRVDTELATRVYAVMKEDNTRITDMIERGLNLALGERNLEVVPYVRQVRFVLANATKDQQWLLRGLAVAMIESLLEAEADAATRREPESDTKTSRRTPQVYGSLSSRARWTDAERRLYSLLEWFLESRNTLPHAEACLNYYSRYGKTAEEIAKLAKPSRSFAG